MPTTTPTKAARRTPARPEPSSVEYIQQALADLDKARGRAGDELRVNVDHAVERLRKAATELRARAEDEASDWEGALERASEEMRRDLGRLAVRAQRTPEALTDMSTEIRKRRSQLR
jgi:uncharacterized protein YicC (UPF0701 family)